MFILKLQKCYYYCVAYGFCGQTGYYYASVSQQGEREKNERSSSDMALEDVCVVTRAEELTWQASQQWRHHSHCLHLE